MAKALKGWKEVLKLIEEPFVVIDKAYGCTIVDFNNAFKDLLPINTLENINLKKCHIHLKNEHLATIILDNNKILGSTLTNQESFIILKIHKIESNNKPVENDIYEFVIDEKGAIQKLISDSTTLKNKLKITTESNFYTNIRNTDTNLITAIIRQVIIEQNIIDRSLYIYNNLGNLEEFNICFCYNHESAKNKELLVRISKENTQLTVQTQHLWENALFSVSKSVKGLTDKFVSSDSLLILNKTFNADFTFLAKYDPITKNARTLFLASKSGILENFEYPLAKTPCETVVGHGVCLYEKNVQQIFPEDLLLAEMGIESYAGVPIKVLVNGQYSDYYLVSMFKSKLSLNQASFLKKMLVIISVFYELEIEKDAHLQYGLELTKEKQKTLEGLKEYAFLTSHELRAPLTNLLGLTQSDNFDFKNDDELREYISYIRASCIKLEETTRKMNQIVDGNYAE
ncbi:MAG: hypothetical protein ACPGLV_15870 [Bacteroidia bacterium]